MNISLTRWFELAAAGVVLVSAGCSTQPAHPTAATRYCAELKGIRAAKSIGCKDDEIGGLANTRGPNTSIDYPH
jgi:hypothetical protein